MDAEKLSNWTSKQTLDTKAETAISIFMSRRAVISSSKKTSKRGTDLHHLWATNTCCSTTRPSPFEMLKRRREARFAPGRVCQRSRRGAQRRTERFLSPFPHFVLVVADRDVLQCVLVELHCCQHGSVEVPPLSPLPQARTQQEERHLSGSRMHSAHFSSAKRKKKKKKREPAAQ